MFVCGCACVCVYVCALRYVLVNARIFIKRVSTSSISALLLSNILSVCVCVCVCVRATAVSLVTSLKSACTEGC